MIQKYLRVGVISSISLITLLSCNNDKKVTKQWYEDESYINSLTTADIGITKYVTVNSIAHKVRLIGIDHDEDIDGNKLHTTWEFANLICDKTGHSLAWQWLDTDDKPPIIISDDYPNSSVRKILCGSGNFKYDVYCASKSSKNDWDLPFTNKTILSMLPESLQKKLKTIRKYVRTGNDFKTKTDCSDKLFMLSRLEMTGDVGSQDEGTVYKYYEVNHTKQAYVKKQINSSEKFLDVPHIKTYRQQYQSELGNFAGYNYKTDETGGGLYWLRSPNPTIADPDERVFAYHIGPDGRIEDNMVSTIAIGLAPAFCL